MYFFLGETNFFSLINHCLPVVLHLGVGPHGLYLTHMGMSTGISIIQILFRPINCCNFIDAASPLCLEVNIKKKTPLSSVSYKLSSPSFSMYL